MTDGVDIEVIAIITIMGVTVIVHRNNAKHKVIHGTKQRRNLVQVNAILLLIVSLELVAVAYLARVIKLKQRQEKVLLTLIDLNKRAQHRVIQITQVLETVAAQHLVAQAAANNRIDNHGTITIINESPA